MCGALKWQQSQQRATANNGGIERSPRDSQRSVAKGLVLLVVLQLSNSAGNRVGGCTHSWLLGGKPEQLFDEPVLTLNIIALDPPNLSFPDHVHRLIALNRSPSRVKFPETLLGIDSAFDRAMILLDDVVQ